ncbi:C39 family peptidase [Natrinema pallidum]|nr:C39 family peptidase [Natrinema pallidum]
MVSVKKREAKKLARKAADILGNRDEYSDWRSQGIRRPELFMAQIENGQSVSYKPRAWVFPIENRGDDVGYITIDATKSGSTVLAYGRSSAPQRYYDEAGATANSRGLSAQRMFLYNGGVEFGIVSKEGPYIDLRGGYVREKPLAKNMESLSPDSGTVNIAGKDGDGDDWERSTDEEITGVPNWTESDGGGVSSTNYGNGRDAWGGWDGCVPIASSMVIGYHEDISRREEDKKNALIDHLHDIHNTDDDGNTDRLDLDNVKNYSRGQYSYDANRDKFGVASSIHEYIKNDRPVVLSMVGGPYSSLTSGHAVTVVGYDHESNALLDDHYYKAHHGQNKARHPDQVTHGNWVESYLVRIWKE